MLKADRSCFRGVRKYNPPGLLKRVLGGIRSVRKENISTKLNQFVFDLFTFFCLSLGASACLKLNQFEEAITWCDKGLSVSFIQYNTISFI